MGEAQPQHRQHRDRTGAAAGARDAVGRVLHLLRDRGRDDPAGHADRGPHADRRTAAGRDHALARVRMPADAANWRRFLFQACLNSVIPWTMVAWGTRALDAGVATILNSTAPIFTFFLTLRDHPPRGGDVPKAGRRRRGDGGHLPDRRHAGAGGTGRAIGGADRDVAGRRLLRGRGDFRPRPSRISIRWRRRRDRCCAAPRS